jgi:hypothetical protein
MTCARCDSIIPGRRNADGHERLKAQGTPRRTELAGQVRARVQQYVCEVCDTRWQYQDEGSDHRVGWSRQT